MPSSLIRSFSLAFTLLTFGSTALAQEAKLTVSGTDFLMNGEPFAYTGVTFFNAIYNRTFNRSSAERLKWIDKFNRYGVNVLRVWGQWDNKRGFIDSCDTCTLYYPDGRLRMEHVETLKEIVRDAATRETVILLALFARESWNEDIRLNDQAAYERAAAAVAREVEPFGNIVLQVWNEHDAYTVPIYHAIKAVDPDRLVTNSPGYGGILGSNEENRLLDYLSPHTSRNADAHWEIAPHEIALLIEKFEKPVVDDEPARTGTANFGGPGARANYAFDHILRMYNVWQVGGYVVYHHDMFQTGYGTPPIPPSGIPDPEHSDYHRLAFEFLALKDRYMPAPGRR